MEMLERTSYLDELSGLLRQVVRHLMILGAATAIASRTSTTASQEPPLVLAGKIDYASPQRTARNPGGTVVPSYSAPLAPEREVKHG
jgi:hypothetical protein